MAYTPRILLLDYEVAPWEARLYGPKFEPRVTKILRHQYILCGSYAWLHEEKVRTKALIDFPLYKRDRHDDKALVQFFCDLINQADVLVAYNLKKFDYKQLATRLAYHGLPQHKPVKLHDPLVVIRSRMYLPSNSLEDAADFFGFPKKGHAPDGTVDRVLDGDKRAWKDLIEYCHQDTKVLIDAYKFTRGISTGAQHPNLNLFTGGVACPSCGSSRSQRRGQVPSKKETWRRQCLDCFKWFTETIDKKGDVHFNN